MKKLINSLFLAGTIMLLISSCKGKDKVASGDPKSVLVAFFERMAKKDLDGAAKLATKDSKGTIDMMKKSLDMAEKMGGMKDSVEKDPVEEFKKMVIGDAKIDGDKATVSVSNPSKDNNTFDFPLKMEDGGWKVDFSMGTLMKMGMEKIGKKDDNSMYDTDTSGIDDRMKNFMNSDSMKDAMQKFDSIMKNIDPEKREKMKDLMNNLKDLNKEKN